LFTISDLSVKLASYANRKEFESLHEGDAVRFGIVSEEFVTWLENISGL